MAQRDASSGEGELSRRDFVGNSVKGAAAVALAAPILNQPAHAQGGGLPVRALGKTGADVSVLCLGGWHIGFAAQQDEAEAIRIMHAAIDEGMTFFDNAWDYHDGGSEIVMGKALASPAKRDKVFLMTKGCDRDYDGAMRCIDESLKRLQTDHIDLWQFHEIVYDNDPDWVFDQNGIQAAIDAKAAGKIRHIGFTGHRDPRIHQAMLDKPFDWETVQLPINMMDAQFRSFLTEIVPQCVDRGAGVIGMKTLGGGVITGQAGISADTCIRYALSQPVSSIVVGITTMDELRQNAASARDFAPMPGADQAALLASVKDVAGDGRYELYKTTQRMDGPYHVKQHGFQVA
ncbi:MAG: aldo/keto reductase [Gammaproteobacteria bacterium]|nr:aldo/keto reductase [Gammaproteobacteria bacterium]